MIARESFTELKVGLESIRFSKLQMELGIGVNQSRSTLKQKIGVGRVGGRQGVV